MSNNVALTDAAYSDRIVSSSPEKSIGYIGEISVLRFSRIVGVFGMLGLLLGVAAPAAAAIQTANVYFYNTWAQTDQPVAAGKVNRTWMWGPTANTTALSEPYVESPGGQRQVQYFDKTRMEITHPDGDASSIWYVTNGLLAKEMITGQLQLGDNKFQSYAPAQVNVAGDANDPNGPTYATFNKLMNFGAIPSGWIISQTVDRAGNVGISDSAKSYNVTAQDVGSPTKHNVASVFWDFMNSSGTVYANGGYSNAKLFNNPFYATGYPLTEAYWTNVLVGGVQKQVLVQVFERRVLTYTPSNPDGWKVEAGNVGQHYYTWRYTDLQQVSSPGTGGSSPNPPGTGGSQPNPPATPATTFGDGTFRVGTDIAAGTYKNSDSSQGCYWERDSSFDGSVDSIIANSISISDDIVTISPTDVGFTSDSCGTWTLDNTALTSSPTAPFVDGTYRVSRDISPGLWRNSDSSQSCYWQRVSGFGGTLDEIIDNGLSDQIQTVQIEPGDIGFSSENCGTWTRIGN